MLISSELWYIQVLQETVKDTLCIGWDADDMIYMVCGTLQLPRVGRVTHMAFVQFKKPLTLQEVYARWPSCVPSMVLDTPAAAYISIYKASSIMPHEHGEMQPFSQMMNAVEKMMDMKI